MAVKYFAYGSNLDLPQMKRRCPSSKLISKGTLSGHRLTFNRFSSGTSLYERWKAVIDTPDGQVCDVWVYTVVEKQKFVQPTLEYLQIIKDAAVRWDFPKVYQQTLELASIRTEAEA